MTLVDTEYGRGEIKDSQITRGTREFLVVGNAFSVWLSEQKLRKQADDSVTLPYDPTPQFTTLESDGSSTIQPTHEIDPEERLSPADSITFENESTSEAGTEPGPSPQLFASIERELHEVIRRQAHQLESNLDPRVGEIMDLVESNKQVREAAWKDVRQKALRLRRDGQVHVESASPEAIYASVKGDNGTYDTIIIRGKVFDLGGQSVTEWSCSCFLPGTKVTMEDGSLKEIEKILPGERVRTGSGKSAKVLNTQEKFYSDTIYGVRPSGYSVAETIWATKEHPWYSISDVKCEKCTRREWVPSRCVHRERVGSYVKTEDLTPDHYFNIPIPQTEERSVVFDLTDYMDSFREREDGLIQPLTRCPSGSPLTYTRKDTGKTYSRKGRSAFWNATTKPIKRHVKLDWELAYLLGMFTGDGSFGDPGEMCYTFSPTQQHFAEEVVRIYEEKFGITGSVWFRHNSWNVRVNSIPVRRLFHHLVGEHSRRKKLSEELVHAPLEVLEGFVRGYVDSDGHIDKQHYWYISSVNRTLIGQTQDILHRLGYRTALTANSAEQQASWPWSPVESCLPCYALTWNPNAKRQSSQQFVEDGKIWIRVNKDIQSKYYEGPVYNLEVEEEHTYTVNGIHVHNCDWGKWAFKRRVSYIGRFCSHALAAYHEMQSRANKSRKQWKRKKKSSRDDGRWEVDNKLPNYNSKSRDLRGDCLAKVGGTSGDGQMWKDLLQQDVNNLHQGKSGSRMQKKSYDLGTPEHFVGWLDETGSEFSEDALDRYKYESALTSWELDDLKGTLRSKLFARTASPAVLGPLLKGVAPALVSGLLDGDDEEEEDDEGQSILGANESNWHYSLYGFKEADKLRTQPFRLTPDFVFNDTEPEHYFTSLEDERVTTGPDQIVHLSGKKKDPAQKKDWFLSEEDTDFNAASADEDEDLENPYKVSSYEGVDFDDQQVSGFVDRLNEEYPEVGWDSYSEHPSEGWERAKSSISYDDLRKRINDAYSQGELGQIDASRLGWDLEDFAGLGTSSSHSRRSFTELFDHTEAFQGSGPVQKDYVYSSEDYLKTHTDRFIDVTEGDGITKYTEDEPTQKESALQIAASFGVSQDYETFTSERGLDPSTHRGLEAFLGDIGRSYGDYDIESLRNQFRISGKKTARRHLRVAGRQYTIAQQEELINERHPDGARNLDGLDLEGTHYVEG